MTLRIEDQSALAWRRQVVLWRKDLSSADERLGQARVLGFTSLFEMAEQLAIAQAMLDELNRELIDVLRGYGVHRPTRHETRLLLEEARRGVTRGVLSQPVEH